MASQSLIKQAYDYIRERIMLGEFMPGELLSENELADRLGMSRTPVRTAISQLETEGFVASLKNRGILVKELSMKEALDLIEVLYTFQLFSVDLMEERGELPDLELLGRLLREQLVATAQGDYASYVDRSMQFTRALVAVTHNNAMLRTIDASIDKIRLYATVNYKITPHEPHYSANKVNEALFEALKRKDYAAMRAVLKQAHARNLDRLPRSGRI